MWNHLHDQCDVWKILSDPAALQIPMISLIPFVFALAEVNTEIPYGTCQINACGDPAENKSILHLRIDKFLSKM